MGTRHRSILNFDETTVPLVFASGQPPLPATKGANANIRSTCPAGRRDCRSIRFLAGLLIRPADLHRKGMDKN